MNKNRIGLVNGSSRPDGNSSKIGEILDKHLPIDHFWLNNYEVGYFDYHNNNKNDDFLGLVRQLLAYEIWILLTPVYWYTMSGQMKTFLDRFSDILKWRKEWLVDLQKIKWYVVSCGSEEDEIPGFFVPFRLSASYLNIDYIGDTHVWKDNHLPVENKVIQALDKVIYNIQKISKQP